MGDLLYSLYLDASGTHGNSPVYILAGVAVHEQDAFHLQQRFSSSLDVLPAGADARDFELHATEIKSPNRAKKSIWNSVSPSTRHTVLERGYRSLKGYRPVDKDAPIAMFGAVIERSYSDYEQRAWEEVLHRFDEMLTRRAHEPGGTHERGIVIHDRSDSERQTQDWTDRWRELEGRIGKLTHLTDVPFFSDSRASRLLQAADFVAWSLWRYYGLSTADARWADQLWSKFDQADGQMHGLVHVRKNFKTGNCDCKACQSRVTAKAKRVARKRSPLKKVK